MARGVTPRAISERTSLTVERLRNHCRLSTDKFDETLTQNLAEAIDEAEQFLNNPFLNADGTPGPIPPKVEGWILRAAARKFRTPAGAMQQESMERVGVYKPENGYEIYYRELYGYRKTPRLGTRRF